MCSMEISKLHLLIHITNWQIFLQNHYPRNCFIRFEESLGYWMRVMFKLNTKSALHIYNIILSKLISRYMENFVLLIYILIQNFLCKLIALMISYMSSYMFHSMLIRVFICLLCFKSL